VNLIERLKYLLAEYNEWQKADEPHANDQAREAMEYIPKLLAVVEAAQASYETQPTSTGGTMKINIGRVFDSGPVIEAFSKAGIKGANDFLTYMADLSNQVVNALRGTLTIEDNLDSLVKVIELKHGESIEILLPDQKKMPKHVFPTKAIPFANAVITFNWQMTQTGTLEVVATFTGTPTAPVQVNMVILFQ
jgi:hypothetical protein